MNSRTFDSRPNSSVDRISSKEKSHPSASRPESNITLQRQSYPRCSRPPFTNRRSQATGTDSIHSDGSWKAPEVLAWKRPQRAARVTRSTTPERQANYCNTPVIARGGLILQDPHSQKHSTHRKGSDCSAGASGTRRLSEYQDIARNGPRQELNSEALECQARRTLCNARHQSAPSTLNATHILEQQHQSLTRQDKLASLSKDFHDQVVGPRSNRCIQPSEEGMASSLASKKVVHWLHTSRNRTERPRTASVTQALRFTALLAQVPLADAGLDEKIIPSRYNPKSLTPQGSRFAGC